jgi:hypothetical protein
MLSLCKVKVTNLHKNATNGQKVNIFNITVMLKHFFQWNNLSVDKNLLDNDRL